MTQQPDPELGEFADTIRHAFRGLARETDGRHEGRVWQWGHRGLWTIHAGATLAPEPVIAGPAGEWRIARADRAGARFALLLLAAADALPDGVDLPAEHPVGRAPVPATLRADPLEVVGGPASLAQRQAAAAGRPLPRPATRVPGANTGARPGPGFVRPATPEGLRPHAGGYPYGQPLADVDLPAPGMGPGAGYAPEVIRDDRAEPRCAPEVDAPMVVAGSDLPARGGYEPPAPAYEPPAATYDPPAAYDSGPSASCD